MILRTLRRITPRPLMRQYHRALAKAGAVMYRTPSRNMVVIGVTGTDGKTTTATMIAALLKAAGHRVGLSSTVYMQIGDQRWLNESHMTMPGRLMLQKLLRRMADAGCTHAVLEVSSEGLAQHRLNGIDVDVAVLTNLTPEHIEAHGSFEAYRAAKGKLFATLQHERKRLNGRTIPTIAILNADDHESQWFKQFAADERYAVTLADAPVANGWRMVRAHNITLGEKGSSFTVEGNRIEVSLPGKHNVANAVEAVAVARALDVPWDAIANGMKTLGTVPGRFEEFPSPRGFSVVVDYALTPAALEGLYRTLQSNHAEIIAVFGAAGGGRDRWKRPRLGEIAAKYASQIILTTDDPHSESPATICEEIRSGIPASYAGHVTTILNRRDAIQEAISRAKEGTVVAVTGMGAETSMLVDGKKVPWSDTAAVRELLQ